MRFFGGVSGRQDAPRKHSPFNRPHLPIQPIHNWITSQHLHDTRLATDAESSVNTRLAGGVYSESLQKLK